MLEFILGSLFTLTVAAISFRAGMYVGARVEPELFNDLKKAFKPKKKLESGPIKPMSQAERESETNAYLNNTIKDLRKP